MPLPFTDARFCDQTPDHTSSGHLTVAAATEGEGSILNKKIVYCSTAASGMRYTAEA